MTYRKIFQEAVKEAHKGNKRELREALKRANEAASGMKLKMGIDADAELVDENGQPVSSEHIAQCKQALVEQMSLFDMAVANRDVASLKMLEADWQAGVDEYLRRN